MNLRVMTYNIQSGHSAYGAKNINGICEFIRSESPDILTLNEVHSHTTDIQGGDHTDFLSEKLHLTGVFGAAMPWHGGAYGIALLTRFPVLKTEKFPIPQPADAHAVYYEPRVILKNTLEIAGKAVSVYSTHFGLTDAEYLNGASLIKQLVQNDENPVFFMGDLNTPPESQPIQIIRSVLTDSGEGKGFLTFPSKAPDRQIDYIFHRGSMRLENAFVPASLDSDHDPLIADYIL